MGNFKKDVLTAVERAGLIVLLAGGSELVSQGITYVSGHNVSGIVPGTAIMAGLGFVQNYLSQQLKKEETL